MMGNVQRGSGLWLRCAVFGLSGRAETGAESRSQFVDGGPIHYSLSSLRLRHLWKARAWRAAFLHRHHARYAITIASTAISPTTRQLYRSRSGSFRHSRSNSLCLLSCPRQPMGDYSINSHRSGLGPLKGRTVSPSLFRSDERTASVMPFRSAWAGSGTDFLPRVAGPKIWEPALSCCLSSRAVFDFRSQLSFVSH